MSAAPHAHGHACQCGHHAAAPPTSGGDSSWARLLAIVSCAFCPTCLAALKPLASLVGVSFALSEDAHGVLLLGALFVALEVAFYEAVTRGLRGAYWLTLAGAACMFGGHLLGEQRGLEAAGMALMLVAVAGRWVRNAKRRPPTPVEATP